jgi:hypothetical protein
LSEINAIENLTGHVPSILACDYSNGWDPVLPIENKNAYELFNNIHVIN